MHGGQMCPGISEQKTEKVILKQRRETRAQSVGNGEATHNKRCGHFERGSFTPLKNELVEMADVRKVLRCITLRGAAMADLAQRNPSRRSTDTWLRHESDRTVNSYKTVHSFSSRTVHFGHSTDIDPTVTSCSGCARILFDRKDTRESCPGSEPGRRRAHV